jgi:hypothetical protein
VEKLAQGDYLIIHGNNLSVETVTPPIGPPTFDSAVLNGNTTIGSGGTLTLAGAPTVPLHAATKMYVDDAIGTIGGAAPAAASVTIVDTGGYFVSVNAEAALQEEAARNQTHRTAASPHTGHALTTRQIATGAGLTGGGDLSANRSISIATGGITEAMLDANVQTKLNTVGSGGGGGGVVVASTLPTPPSAAYRDSGVMYLIKGAAGVADRLYVCKKLANDTFTWKQIG